LHSCCIQIIQNKHKSTCTLQKMADKHKIYLMKRVFIASAVVMYIFLFSGYISAQSQIGIPFIQNYPAKIFGQNPQNWAIKQDKRGVLYFGNTDGLLEYDGITWSLYEVSNHSAVRSLDIGDDNRIYVGASGEFGYFETNESGNYIYFSLSERLEEINFNAVWKVFTTSHGVYYFAGRSNIYRFFNDSLLSVIEDERIGDFRGFYIDNELFAIDSRIGICRITDGEIESQHKAISVASKQVYSFLPFGNNKYLLGTRNDGLYIYSEKDKDSEDSIKPFYTEVDQYLIENNLYTGITLGENFAFATLQGGVVIINKAGELVTILNRAKGILADDIYYLYVDKNENLWIAQERGISKVEVSSAFTQFNAINGLDGTIINGMIYNDHLYIGTSIGLYHLLDFNIKEANKPRNIAPISRKYNYILDFSIIKDQKSDREVMLVSSLRNILEIQHRTHIKEVMPLYGCYSIVQSKRDPERAFLGHPNGISSIRVLFPDNVNEEIKYIDEGNIADLKEDIRLLMLDNTGDLWISTAFNGISYMKFNDEEDLMEYELFRYDTDNGLPHNDENEVFNINGKLIVSTLKGLYTLNDTSLLMSNPNEVSFIPDTSFLLNYRKDSIAVTALKPDNKKNIWFGTNKGVLKYVYSNDRPAELISFPMKRIAGNEIEKIFIEENGVPWFSTHEALFRYNFNNRSSIFPNYYALIRKVTVSNDSVIFFGNNHSIIRKDKYQGQDITNNQTIAYDYNSIRFEFAVPSYENEESNLFKYLLEGFDKDWTGWTRETKKEYTNLSEGSYKFRVKAKNIFEVESIEAKYSFVIKPPWYRTLIAFILYGIFIITLAFFGLGQYSKRLKSANIRLEKTILSRTYEIEQQKEEIKAQTERLLQTNKELEKLSLIARETDNAVIIMDPKGNFQWINEGFTRMYGYTFEQLIKEKDRNIIGASSNLQIKDLINIWFGDKKSIIYESLNTTISGEKIWAQTTLTPILDENGIIDKLIAIDSDITKLKEAEEQIEAQRDEIVAQRDLAISQRDEIMEQKKEITDSIIYAKRIQKALLPSNELISKILYNHFILYKPRDIVSGDFYWLAKHENKLVIAAADCTGHGVPGAFMSLIGISFLNEIVNSNKVIVANEILNQLRENIINSLQHSNDEEEASDGMDIAICIVDTNTLEMQYAGANNPVILIRDGNLTELKPDKMPIGSHRLANVSFKNNNYSMKDGDSIYLFTDGYVDQFGGINDKKFKSHNFRKLLLDIQNQPINKQKSILDGTFEDWKGDAEQVDDILVIGFKIKADN